jgi:hypothetical protein
MGRLDARPLIGLAAIIDSCSPFAWLSLVSGRMSLTVSPTDISAGQQVVLQWTSWPPSHDALKLNGESLEDNCGELIQHPLATTLYRLTGDTWASRLFSPGTVQHSRTVNVTPVTPQILLFQAKPPQVDSGAFTEISWEVIDADRLVLR